MGDRSCSAFAPGRVNVIGEHTDYNQGLALPFAILQGVTVNALECPPEPAGTATVEALAADLQETDRFRLDDPAPASGWRAFVRGAVAELTAAGMPLVGARLEISGDVPQGSGLSSSAALSVSLCLALAELASHASRTAGELPLERIELARICSRVEHRWAGAQTGLLDQLASLYGALDTALLIDFKTLEIEAVPLRLAGWRFVVADSGERHAHAASGYNERREECTRACELLGVESLREARPEELAGLPEPERMRATHVLGENERVLQAVAALRTGEPELLGELMSASHRSLRDLFQVSTPAVEATVERLLGAGASGARLVGGGFGGSVLALLAPGLPTPPGALAGQPGPGRPSDPRGFPSKTGRQEGSGECRNGQREQRERPVQRRQHPRQRELLAGAVGQRSRALDAERSPAQLACRRAQSPLREAQRHAPGRHQQAGDPDFERVHEIAREGREAAPPEGEPQVTVKSPPGQLEVVGGHEQAARDHKRGQPGRDGDDPGDSDRHRTEQGESTGQRQRPVGKAGLQRPVAQLIEHVGTDPDGQPEGAERPQQPPGVDVRCDAGAQGDVTQVPQRVGRVENRQRLPRPSRAQRVEGRSPGGGDHRPQPSLVPDITTPPPRLMRRTVTSRRPAAFQ